MIEDKRISEGDKIHYLKRYVSGQAREAISGYFLLRSDSAFEQAKALLEERNGNQFIVTEAFHDKLEAWPKIHGREGNSLRRFSDYLNQCHAAMMDMKGLEILNDNRENRKLLQKLPDWVVNRWSRIVSTSCKSKGMYASFGQFAEFIIPEQEEKEMEKGTTMNERKKRNHAARTLASDTRDNESLSCFLCKRNSNVLAECRTFGVKPVGEKQELVKKNGLCIGCLQHGHMSKGCTQKSTCKICHKRHSTSIHMEQKPAGEESMTKTLEKSNKSKDVTKPEKEAFCSKVSNIGSECMSTMTSLGIVK